MEFETTQKPIMRTGTVRSTLASPGEAWDKLTALAGPSGLMGQPGVSTAGMFPSTVMSASSAAEREQAWYAAALVVPEGTALPDGMAEERLPGGRFARGVYYGPYEGLGGAWGELEGWIKSTGRTVREGVCYELYRNAPGQVPDAELRTDLYIPID